ncbi:MAG TPA: fatty acid desaturase [Acidobacteriaceae bacterium]|nr:fatty acid desaturase [Acidobacteriaceae bacterium]
MSPVLVEEPTAEAALPASPTTTKVITPIEIEAARKLAADVALKVKQDLRMGREHQEDRVNWITAIFMGLFHVGAIAALFFFSWTNLAVALITYFFAINVGIGMAYHRLLTHRGYKTPKWVEYFITACGTMALEGGPIFWVATHRVHHQNSDHEGDPHTPHDGTWWAHMGWIISGRALHSETALLGRYAPDLTRDKGHVWLSKFHWVPITVVGILQIALGFTLAGSHATLGHRMMGGLSMLLWGTFLRTVIGLHATWLVNSATHMFGSRRFETKDDSRNSWWVAMLTGGEGWHNNHHAHPVSARHGLAWYEFDLNYCGIWLLGKLGLAEKIQIAKFDPADPKPAGM